MGASKELQRELREKEYILLDINTSAFERIHHELHQEEYFIRKVDVKDFDYSYDKKWVELSIKSKKAYKELKEREYELRMKINDDAKKEEK